MKKIFVTPEINTLNVESTTIIAASTPTGGGPGFGKGTTDTMDSRSQGGNTGIDNPSHGEGISAIELN